MLLNDLGRRILFVLSVFLMPVEVWATVPSADVEVRLEREVTVGADTVVLGDVATIYAKSIHDFQALSSLMISKIPGDQGELRLPQGYLENRIREALPPGTNFKLRSPELVVFRVERIGVTAEQFAQEVLKRGRHDGKIPEWAEVEVETVGGFDALQLHKLADIRFAPAAEMNRWKGEMAFKVSQKDKSDVNWVKVKLRWFARAWVAKRNIGILTNPQPEDFSAARVEVTASREDPVLASEDISSALRSARAKRTLTAGAPLSVGALEKAPDAKPGQPLKVVFVSESGIRVTTDGALLGAASIGNEVRAKLRASRKVITGKLVSSGLVEVSL